MRVLHAGHADHRPRAAPGEPVADRARDPRGHLRQFMPLHRLSGHRRRRPPRRRARRGDGRVRNPMASPERRWIGKDVPRLEDPRLLAGRATYTDALKLSGMLHAAVLRSPHPHARITRIDTSRARALAGVFAVITGEDAKELTNPLPAFCAEPVVQYALAVDKVRFVGEAVAAV